MKPKTPIDFSPRKKLLQFMLKSKYKLKTQNINFYRTQSKKDLFRRARTKY